MKAFYFTLAVSAMLLLSGCDYFKNHRLFSKDKDEAVDRRPEKSESDTSEVIFTDDEEVDDMDLSEGTADMPAEVADETFTPQIDQPDYSPRGSDRYFMIVGSFMNQNLANRCAGRISKQGYSTSVLECPDGYYRVSAKSYSDYRQGVREVSEFRSNLSSEAWLYVQK